MRTSMKTATIAALLALAAGNALGQTYKLVDLGVLEGESLAMGFGPGGVPVGTSTGLDSHFRATAFDGPSVLVTPAGPGEGFAFGSLADGSIYVVGYTLGGLSTQGFLTSGGVATSLGAFTPRAANASGALVGTTTTTTVAGIVATRACIWQSGVLTVLPTLGGLFAKGLGINDAGWIVGDSTTTSENGLRAVVWYSGVAHDLGTLGGASAQAASIDGLTVVGWSQNAAGLRRPTKWTLNIAGAVLSRTDLGTTLSTRPGFAKFVSPTGDIVGTSGFRAMLWRSGAAIDLAITLINPDAAWTLDIAWATDDQGRIVGSGTRLGYPRAFELVPCVADVSGDHAVDFADFLAFFNAFDTDGPAADVNRDNTVDFADFLAFFNGFDAGC
jgi:probable HAF family extracellular repeat protein